ncbi:hypothetical protein HDU86_008400 [Geranomyces michiganensis]|nr:hypothetical protein HDU86_008400 [Geranomyces michiganensis]
MVNFNIAAIRALMRRRQERQRNDFGEELSQIDRMRRYMERRGRPGANCGFHRQSTESGKEQRAESGGETALDTVDDATSTTDNSPSFATLPTEILLIIIAWLAPSFNEPERHLVSLGHTCRRMRLLVAAKLYFHTAFFFHNCLREFADTVASNPGMAGQVRHFMDNVDELHAHRLRRVCGACSNLLSLHLGRCSNLTNKALRDVANRSTRLKSLTIKDADRITDEGLLSVGKRCPSLEYFNVYNVVHITDRSIVAIADGCPLLRGVILRGCRGIAVGSIKYLMLKATYLRELTLIDFDDVCLEEVLRSKPEGLYILLY